MHIIAMAQMTCQLVRYHHINQYPSWIGLFSPHYLNASISFLVGRDAGHIGTMRHTLTMAATDVHPEPASVSHTINLPL